MVSSVIDVAIKLIFQTKKDNLGHKYLQVTLRLLKIKGKVNLWNFGKQTLPGNFKYKMFSSIPFYFVPID